MSLAEEATMSVSHQARLLDVKFKLLSLSPLAHGDQPLLSSIFNDLDNFDKIHYVHVPVINCLICYYMPEFLFVGSSSPGVSIVVIAPLLPLG